MGELRDDHADAPQNPPDPPPGDHARPPAPQPRDRAHPREPGTTNDPRAIRAAFREAESPAFAVPHVELRYVTDPHPDRSPTSPAPYRTSHDRPPTPDPDPPDGPSHHAPDLEPPNGTELAEQDAPGASRLDRARKKFFEAENLDNEQSTIHDWGDLFQDTVLEKPQTPPSARTESRAPHTISETPHHGIETGDTLTAMFFAGILLGESVRAVYRKASEPKERLHARNG